ncbi:hypothetical protein PVAND_016815 [Polypedilum vanderplanki]|uniref:Uncharacterized protein n=1 Tax=Polypedilum vanderplanki TaxID=319348 RepID=A0A9J6BG89_POLVA|nr:hypothetical protein PVAND_016815 [Polypedilum vanderplanki]
MKDVKFIFLCFTLTVIITQNKADKSEEKEIEFECANKFYRYYLDDEPAEYGVSAGLYAPDKKAYVGLSIWRKMALAAGRIQIDPPGILVPDTSRPSYFVNDSSQIWFLKRRSRHHYKWIPSGNGTLVPFAIEFGRKSSGMTSYIGRIVIKNTTVFVGLVLPDMNVMYYIDNNNNFKAISDGYEVLTCRTHKNETALPLPTIPSSSSGLNVDSPNGCINNWQPYNLNDAPITNGISAGEFDCGNVAYVGYSTQSGLNTPGRVQVIDPKGVYTIVKKKEILINDSSIRYLVDNPNYTYSWVKYDGSNSAPSNAVFVRSPVGQFSAAVARVSQNGHTKLGSFVSQRGYFPSNDGNTDEYYGNFEILVCDPWPKYKCLQQWKQLNSNNSNPSTDGFSLGSNSFIGRSTRKYVNGCNFVLGQIQSSSVNYADDLTGAAVFDNSNYAEYLVKNPSYTYKWTISSSGAKIKNALTLQKEGFSSFYIGMTNINNNVIIGKVLPGKGLFYLDPVCGKRQATDSYSVLTCTSPDASNGEDNEHNHANWFNCPAKNFFTDHFESKSKENCCSF